MFKKLTDFSYKRNFIEALGFYIAYLLLGGVIGAIIGGVYAAAINSSNQFQDGLRAGALFAIIYCTALALIIIREKKIINRFSSILLFLLSILCPMIMGSLLGLIPVAILSSMKAKEDENIVQKEE